VDYGLSVGTRFERHGVDCSPPTAAPDSLTCVEILAVEYHTVYEIPDSQDQVSSQQQQFSCNQNIIPHMPEGFVMLSQMDSAV